MPGGLCRDVAIKCRREGSVGVPRLAGGGLGRRPLYLLSCGVACVAVVSGSDVVQDGIFFFL